MKKIFLALIISMFIFTSCKKEPLSLGKYKIDFKGTMHMADSLITYEHARIVYIDLENINSSTLEFQSPYESSLKREGDSVTGTLNIGSVQYNVNVYEESDYNISGKFVDYNGGPCLKGTYSMVFTFTKAEKPLEPEVWTVEGNFIMAKQ